MKTAAELEKLYHEAHDIAESAIKNRNELWRSLNEARIREANHEWLGKEVCREVTVGYVGKTMIKRGVVTVYEPSKHHNLRELYAYNLKAGEPIVIHKNGRTGWLFNIPAYSRDKPWSLAGAVNV